VNSEQGPPQDDGPSPTSPGTPDTGVPERGARGSRRPGTLVRVIAGVAIGVLALAVASDLATSSPRLCGSCHEMEKRAGTWSASPHSGITCVTCHQTPRPWYALPARLVDRTRLLARDVGKHLAGGYRDPVDGRVAGSPPMADAVCLQCHDPNRKATSGFRITIDHVAHAKRNGSCVSCHVRTAHPVESRGAALSLMAACFTCHGTARTAKAPGRCDLCHPSGYELLPASHKVAAWKASHGKVALVDLKQCEMCHAKSTCDACHGLEMPHPMGWSKGRPGHGDVAARDRALCSRCHVGKPDMCTMCHHEAFDPKKGTWAEQHSTDAETRGVAFCIECHSAFDCVRCHKSEEE
jgi:hypothetical protein